MVLSQCEQGAGQKGPWQSHTSSLRMRTAPLQGSKLQLIEEYLLILRFEARVPSLSHQSTTQNHSNTQHLKWATC